MEIQLGSKIKDIITGFEGVVMARTEYLTGCTHLGVCPNKLSKEGKMQEWEWIDEARCKQLGDVILKLKTPTITEEEKILARESTGGEFEAPQM